MDLIYAIKEIFNINHNIISINCKCKEEVRNRELRVQLKSSILRKDSLPTLLNQNLPLKKHFLMSLPIQALIMPKKK